MNSDLLRQRRNLILISSVLIIFDFARVSIAKISVLGTELLIGDAKTLMIFVWVVWAYAFLRYYQYLRAEGDLRILAMLQVKLHAKVRAYVFRQIKKDHVSGSIQHTRDGFRWKYSVYEYVPGKGKEEMILSGPIPWLLMIWWQLATGVDVSINTPKATDHILPILLAVAAPTLRLIG